MAEQKNSSKGKPGKAGKRKGKFTIFFARTAEKKLRHLRKHNGRNALTAYKDWLFNTRNDSKRGVLQLPKA